MATERTPVDGLIEQDPEEAKDVSITVENPESVAIETEDGGMLIDFDPESKDNINAGFNSNLVDFIDDNELESLWVHTKWIRTLVKNGRILILKV